MCLQLAVVSGLERCQEICFVIRIKLTEHVVEGDVAIRLPRLWAMAVIHIKARVGLFMAGQQCTECVNNGCLSYIVSTHQNVQACLEAELRFLQLPKVLYVQFGQIHKCPLPFLVGITR